MKVKHKIQYDQSSYYEFDDPVYDGPTAKGCLTSIIVGIIFGALILTLIYFQR